MSKNLTHAFSKKLFCTKSAESPWCCGVNICHVLIKRKGVTLFVIRSLADCGVSLSV